MRLGLLMALTMTLHNLPEGFAVSFYYLPSKNAFFVISGAGSYYPYVA